MGVLKRKLRRTLAVRKKRPAAVGTFTAGTRVMFRAEVMPGRGSTERTFTVSCVLTGGRVELSGLAGEHAITEFATAQH
jgi:hypothetical protein